MTASLMSPITAATFEQDVAFLRKHLEVIVLSDSTGQGPGCGSAGVSGTGDDFDPRGARRHQLRLAQL
jgi:hypothetical protein